MSSADEWLRSAEEQSAQALEEAADLRTVVSTTRGSARSADGLVSAVVAPGLTSAIAQSMYSRARL